MTGQQLIHLVVQRANIPQKPLSNSDAERIWVGEGIVGATEVGVEDRLEEVVDLTFDLLHFLFDLFYHLALPYCHHQPLFVLL